MVSLVFTSFLFPVQAFQPTDLTPPSPLKPPRFFWPVQPSERARSDHGWRGTPHALDLAARSDGSVHSHGSPAWETKSTSPMTVTYLPGGKKGISSVGTGLGVVSQGGMCSSLAIAAIINFGHKQQLHRQAWKWQGRQYSPYNTTAGLLAAPGSWNSPSLAQLPPTPTPCQMDSWPKPAPAFSATAQPSPGKTQPLCPAASVVQELRMSNISRSVTPY